MNVHRTLLEHWDGFAWSIQDSPNPDNAAGVFISGVTCVASADCWAVGYYLPRGVSSFQTLAEHWDGRSWSIVKSDNTDASHTNALFSITCTDSTNCWAVGARTDARGTFQTLAERWDGTVWKLVSSPNVGTGANLLLSVTCISSSDCRSVGYSTGSSADQALIEAFDGTSWITVPSPAAAQGSDHLRGVTCVSASNCWAVGDAVSGVSTTALIEHWDGLAWSVVASPDTGASTGNYLFAVTCAATSDCWAAGTRGAVGPRAGTVDTLVEHWDGRAWTVTPSPNPAPGANSFMFAVRCTASARCWAVGTSYSSRTPNHTLVERWDGSQWTLVSSPNTYSSEHSLLFGVSCPGSTDCWTVGYGYNGSAFQTLTERWQGRGWEIVASPNLSSTDNNELQAVACPSASSCWAVGSTAVANVYQPLLEHWDGLSWSVASSPIPPGSRGATLSAVTCAGIADCWAGGSAYDNTAQVFKSLIEHWDGAAWTIVASPNSSLVEHNFINGISCASSADCWAVGAYSNSVQHFLNPGQTLTQHWDGKAWTIVASANTSPIQANILQAVSCSSSNDCLAVGSYRTMTTQVALAEKWNGSSWSLTPTAPAGASSYAVLEGVSCTSGTCSAVGSYLGAGGNDQTLVEMWDGASWSVTPSANTSSALFNVLHAVSCLTAADCWAVGVNDDTTNADLTLVERSPASPPPVIPEAPFVPALAVAASVGYLVTRRKHRIARLSRQGGAPL
ncbi:MAG: hypothetical protein NVS3B24_21550 [Candidatus Dormibacteria bacterium]